MELKGTLLSLRLFNGWGIGSLQLDDRRIVSVVGNALAGLADGCRYVMQGQVKTHPRYGEQFEVVSALADVELAVEPLARFVADNYANCGRKTARAIVGWYAERDDLATLRDILIERPWLLPQTEAASGRSIALIEQAEGLMETRVYRRLAVHLSGHGIPDAVLRRLGAHLYTLVGQADDPPAEAWKVLVKDPYRPIPRVDGYGFTLADTVGRALGIPAHAPARQAALLHHVLWQCCEEEGHSFVPYPILEARMARLGPDIVPAAAFKWALAAGLQIVKEGERFYLGHLHYAEMLVASRIAEMGLETAQPIFAGSDFELENSIELAEFAMGVDFSLDASQRKALIGILRSRRRIHTLTAGPGCGKTAIMEVFVQVANKHAVLFAAPTGKAAKVLATRVGRFGCSARTIHSLLEPTADGGFSFARNEENPLVAHVVVVDEASMVDLSLMASLLRALPEQGHLILLGDGEQLESVGPGRVLDDILALPGDHHRLNTTHRNRGAILALVGSVREGRASVPKGATDVALVHDAGDPVEGMPGVVSRYLDAVRACGAAQVGFLIPRRKGRSDEPGWNVTYMNSMLQDVMNAGGERIPGSMLRIGDRIIIRRNVLLEPATEDGTPECLVNGDTGSVRAARLADGNVKSLRVLLDDGRDVTIPAEYLDLVGLAYCTTIHAAQGSEYQRVILVVTRGAPGFMHRKLLYTAVSRARLHLTVIGDMAVLAQIAARTAPVRLSYVRERTES